MARRSATAVKRPPRFDLNGNPLPTGVGIEKRNATNPYQAKFKYKNKQIFVGAYSTPDLAAEALLKRRAECAANPTAVVVEKKVVVRELPTGVNIDKRCKINPYMSSFSFNGKTVNVGRFPDSAKALEALNKRKAGLAIDPSTARPAKRPERELPTGVCLQKANKVNPFLASFSKEGKSIFVGLFSSAELAFEAVNKKRVEMGLWAYKAKVKGEGNGNGAAAAVAASVRSDAGAGVGVGVVGPVISLASAPENEVERVTVKPEVRPKAGNMGVDVVEAAAVSSAGTVIGDVGAVGAGRGSDVANAVKV